MEFGYRMKELRKAKGYGVREFARVINKSPSYLSNIEKGSVPPPTAEFVKEIAEALDGDVNELLALAKRFDTDEFDRIRKNAVRLESAEKTIKFLSSAISLDEADHLGGMSGIMDIVVGERILNPDAKGITESIRILQFILGVASTPDEKEMAGLKLRREVARTIFSGMTDTLKPYSSYPVEEQSNMIESILEIFKKYPSEVIEEVVKIKDLLAAFAEWQSKDDE